MKRSLVIYVLLTLSVILLSGFKDGQDDSMPSEYDQGLSFPYGMVGYKNMILVSNSGVEALSDEVKEGKGFISAIQGGVVKTFIRPDGRLVAPKGMAIYDNILFVADLGKIVVYNLKKITNPPVEIKFPQGEVTLTDIEIVGDMLIVSVNNTGHIFGINLRNVSIISQARATLLAELPGAGMMAVSGSRLFVNSFQSEISDSSLVYVADLTSEKENPFKPINKEMTPGQYLGLDVSGEGYIYFTALKTNEISQPMLYKCMSDMKELPRLIDSGFRLCSPTSILVIDKNLWITDYVQSKVYRFDIQ